MVERLAERGREELRRAPSAEVRATYDLRYAGQAFELTVEGDPAPDPDELRRAFDRAHEERYGYADPDAELELVTVRVAVGAARRGAAARGALRTRGFREASAVDGPERSRPASPGSTLVVPPGWRARAEDDPVVMER